MKRRRKREVEGGSFQITPMIDMTFLLLIFFMVTSHLTDMEVAIPIGLPEARAATVPEDRSQRIIVNIDAAGQYYLANQAATEEEVAQYLDLRRDEFPPLRIYLRADQGTPARRIKRFMEMAAEASAVDVIFATLPEN